MLASTNPGKLREFQRLLAPHGIDITAQHDFNIPEAEEPFQTFLENALRKARHAAEATGLAALADDSGLSLHALKGAPGVHSARYAGEPRSDQRNNEKLIAALEGIPDRRAVFVCTLVLVRFPEDPDPLVAQGHWRGHIVDGPRGAGGFGYDPLFVPEGLAMTAAEISAEQKNRMSHRAQAIQRLIELCQL